MDGRFVVDDTFTLSHVSGKAVTGELRRGELRVGDQVTLVGRTEMAESDRVPLSATITGMTVPRGPGPPYTTLGLYTRLGLFLDGPLAAEVKPGDVLRFDTDQHPSQTTTLYDRLDKWLDWAPTLCRSRHCPDE